MITHVAEAAEARGRVVLRLTSGRVQLTAIDAAVRLAKAYHAEIESLCIEDTELLRLASFSFAAEIPALGRRFVARRRPLSIANVERDMRLQFSGLQRLVESRAAAAEVTVRLRIVRDESVRAVATTCADGGPWNVVVLAEPLASIDPGSLDELFASVPDTTGLMVVGHGPVCLNGPVVLAVEDADALPAMLHTAERLVDGTATPILILMVTSDADAGHWLDGQVRLALSERPVFERPGGIQAPVQFMPLIETHGEAAVIAEALRRLAPSFLMARFGGLVVPPEVPLRLLGAVLGCPLLLIR
jgi:hypothetical protein